MEKAELEKLVTHLEDTIRQRDESIVNWIYLADRWQKERELASVKTHALYHALLDLLSIETATCQRLESNGMTGVRSRFLQARAAIARAEGR